MSTLSHHLDRARQRLAAFRGAPTLEFSTNEGSTWTALDAGAILHRDGSSVVWNDRMQAEEQVEVGHLLTAESQTELADGAWIREGGSSGTRWTTIGGPTGDGGFRYQLRREKPADGDTAGTNRGRR